MIATTRFSESEIEAMRAWAMDCDWQDAEDIIDLSPEQVARGIERHYLGGLVAFLADIHGV